MPESLRSFIDAGTDALARAIAAVQREAQRERDLREAQFAAVLAEMRSAIAGVEDVKRQMADRLATVRDGEPGRDVDMDEVERMVSERIEAIVSTWERPKDGAPAEPVDMDEVERMVIERVASAVEAIPPAEPGKSVTVEDVAPILAGMVERAIAELPPAAPGKDADPEAVKALVDETVRDAVAALPPAERGEKGPMGSLPTVSAWQDRVYYEGEVVSFDGGLYQAARDTGKAPDHEDWTCIVRAGRDGENGRSFDLKSTFDPEAEYRHLDVVAMNGASFAARMDNPGPCPGEGWQIIAMQGKRGAPGERGKQGEPGPVTRAVVGANVDGEGRITLKNADGSTVEIDLYDVLRKLRD